MLRCTIVQRSWISSTSKDDSAPARAISITWALGVLCVGTLFSPVLFSPLLGDDQPNILRKAVLERRGISINDYVAEAIHRWWTRQGRFFPVANFEGTLVFTIFHDPVLYKCFQLAVLVLSILATANLLSPIRISPPRWLLASLTISATIQFGRGYDPTISFTSMIPSSWLKIVCAMLLIRHSRTVRYWGTGLGLNLCAVILHVAAILQYELCVLFFPLYFLIPYDFELPTEHSRLGEPNAPTVANVLVSFGTAITISAISLASIIFNIFLVERPQAAPAYTVNLAAREVLPAYLYQSLGAAPLSSAARSWPSSAPTIQTFFILFLLFLGLVGLATKEHISAKLKARQSSFMFGTWLFLAAPASSAISQRWQNELSFDITYINVFYGYIAVGILLYTTLESVLNARAGSLSPRRIGSRTFLNRKIIAVVLVPFLAFSASSNRGILQSINEFGQDSIHRRRSLIESINSGRIHSLSLQAVHGGIVAVVSEAHNPLFLINDNFFFKHADGYSYRTFPSVEKCGNLCSESYIRVEPLADDFVAFGVLRN